jgi:putative addiction module component (TIGR02574 family)
LTPAQREELDRRLDELDRGEGESIPWDEVKRRLRDRSK